MAEKAILIGLITSDVSQEQAYEYLDELAFLAKTAGAKPIRNFIQKLPHPDKIEDGEAVNYRQYEDFIKQLIKAHSAEEYVAELKKGQALIWTSNMLHGGIPVVDEKSTRQSQAIHYFFGGCEKYFHPMFSEPYKGEYAEKWCNEQKNIKTWKS